VTHQKMAEADTPVTLIFGLLTPKCYETIFTQKNFFDAACLSFILSKLLGYSIVASSTIVKVPQILSIVRGKSAAGLNPLMFILENIGYTIGLSYSFNKGFPFSTYGENLFVLIQGFILVYIIFLYNKKLNMQFYVGVILYAIFAITMLGGIIPIHIQKIFQTSTIGIFIAARVPQILTNYRNQSVGKLSAFMVLLNFGGSMARIFTTMKEVGDKVVLLGYVIGTSLNGTLLIQIFYYGDKKIKRP